MPRRLRPRPIGLALSSLGLAFAIGWWGTDVLERQNDFCNACHLDGGGPLHAGIRRDFDARPPASLAALHAERRPRPGPDAREMRCFDCHAGVGFGGRARIKAVAARDLVVWLAGRAREPSGLTVPLRDEDCRQCHPQVASESRDDARPAFHGVFVHNDSLGVACTSCHAVHVADGDPRFHFLSTVRVRAECARCHSQFETARGGMRG
jgi:Cytochrome c7 and related cytochrome c